MLLQQVGFVCAVLALVCCVSGLFGSLGRCGVDVLYGVVRGPELGSLRTATAPSLSDWSAGFPLPALGGGGSAHPGGLRHALDCGAGSTKLLKLPGVPDRAVGVFCWGQSLHHLSLECAGIGRLRAAQR